MICYFVLSLIPVTINITSDKLMPKPRTMYLFVWPTASSTTGVALWHQQLLQHRGVTSVASAGAGDHSHHIYSVGADTSVCTVDAVTGKLLHRFQAGKHALTCVKAASGMLAPALHVPALAVVLMCFS